MNKYRVVGITAVLAVFAVFALNAVTAASSETLGASLALSPGQLDSGDYTRTLWHDGRLRSYILHVPPGLAVSEPAAVVLVFHGGGGNAEHAMRMSGFSEKADEEGFLVVYPNGTGFFQNRLLTFNGGNCCAYAQENNVDDVGFVAALLDDLRTAALVDENWVYATGLSNGAIMSYRLACEMSEQFAAIGPVAATLNYEPCDPAGPVAVIHFHGTADAHAPYEGGVGADSIVQVDFASVSETVDFWVTHNECALSPEREQFGSIVHDTYVGCASEASVELYTILDGGHSWPGGVPSQRPGADQPTDEISATDLMWSFFEAHPKQNSQEQ